MFGRRPVLNQLAIQGNLLMDATFHVYQLTVTIQSVDKHEELISPVK